MRPQSIPDIPIETVEVAHAAFPKGNIYLQLRDALGSIYEDNHKIIISSATVDRTNLLPQFIPTTLRQLAVKKTKDLQTLSSSSCSLHLLFCSSINC